MRSACTGSGGSADRGGALPNGAGDALVDREVLLGIQSDVVTIARQAPVARVIAGCIHSSVHPARR